MKNTKTILLPMLFLLSIVLIFTSCNTYTRGSDINDNYQTLDRTTVIEEVITTNAPASLDKEPTTYGNTSGNLANGGYATLSDDWIYYSIWNDDELGGYLSKMHIDSTEQIHLSDVFATHINIVGDWIYYISWNDNGLYRTRTDGSETIKIEDYINYAGGLVVVEEWIYYVDFDLCKIRVDGTDKTVLLNDGTVRNIFVVDDWVYFNYQKWDGSFVTEKGCYRIRTDGTEKTKLNDDINTCIIISDDWIYYCNVGDDYSLYRMHIDGAEKTKLSDNSIATFNVIENWVYYTDNSDGYLYKMCIDDAEKILLATDNAEYIYIVGDWIYYVNYIEYGITPLYKMRMDGTERQEVA